MFFKKKSIVQTILSDWQKHQFTKESTDKTIISLKEQIKSNSVTVESLFDYWFTLLEKVNIDNNKENQLFYHFTKLLSAKKYLPSYHKYGLNYKELNTIVFTFRNKWIEAQKKLIGFQDFYIVPPKNKNVTGTLGDIAHFPFSMYKQTVQFGKEAIFFPDLTLLVFDFVKSFPNHFHYSITAILEYHTNAITETVRILNHCINNSLYGERSAFNSIFHDILSPFSKKDFYHKNCNQILTLVYKESDNWDKDKIKLFIEYSFYKGFQLDFTPVQEKIERKKAYLKQLEVDKNNEHYDFLVKFATKELNEFEKPGYQVIGSYNWQKAYKKIAVTPKINQLLKLTIATFKGNDNVLEQLLKDAENFKKFPKQFPLNNKPEVVFKDLNFKLFVIEELMYRQELIQPKFSLKKLANEHVKRQISIEDDGYTVIPEALKYFKNLNISLDLLSKVETLIIDNGLLGGTKIYNEIWPFFDPGCGDELLPVKSKVIEDLKLLPNLKKVVGFEGLMPIKKVIKAFEEKNIELIDLDKFNE